MRIGISTACFYPYINTEDTLDIIKDLGFKLCEVFLEAESEMNEKYCFELKNKAERLGIDIYSIHAFNSVFEPFLFDRYNRRRAEMEEKFEKMCRAGKILQAEYYTFHGITSVMNNGEILDIAKGIGHLCDLASKYNLRLSQENVSWCRSCNPEYISQIKKVNPDRLYYTLDIKQAVRGGYRPEEFLEVYKDKLSTVHINDTSTESVCLLPGRGDMQLGRIINSALELNPEVPFIIEVYRENYDKYEELRSARNYIEELID